MTPLTDTNEIRIISYPTLTYRLQFDENRIRGDVDGLEAIEQFVLKTLLTERYTYLIYNWNYGIELQDLFGRSKSFVRAELPRRITEALTVDDRVLAVFGFAFAEPPEKGVVKVSFTVETIFGNVTMDFDYDYAQATFV